MSNYSKEEALKVMKEKYKIAIEDRIEELEKSVGIPELKKLLKDNKYTWRKDSPDSN